MDDGADVLSSGGQLRVRMRRQSNTPADIRDRTPVEFRFTALAPGIGDARRRALKNNCLGRAGETWVAGRNPHIVNGINPAAPRGLNPAWR
jgi:hypothetical protein